MNNPTFNSDGNDDGEDIDKRQQHSVTPPHYQPTVEVLPVGTDSLETITTELERLPKDSRGSKPDSTKVIDLTNYSNDKVSNLLRG